MRTAVSMFGALVSTIHAPLCSVRVAFRTGRMAVPMDRALVRVPRAPVCPARGPFPMVRTTVLARLRRNLVAPRLTPGMSA